MCSIDGAWLAPIPPTTLAIVPSALAHLLADLGQRHPGDAEELDHHVDRHAGTPEADPVARAQQPLLLVGEAELLYPPLLVLCEQLPLVRVLQGVRRLVQADAAHRRLLVEQVELRREVARNDPLQALEVLLRQL